MIPGIRYDFVRFIGGLKRKPLVGIGIAIWVCVSFGSYSSLLAYSLSPGPSGGTTSAWPCDTAIVPDSSRSNLIVFIHPHCPCSRATLAELEEIISRSNGSVALQVLFLKPSEMPAGWEVGALWHRAAAIPGAKIHADEDGLEAQRFGAMTSGQAVLYDQNGELKFRGGITISRGHRGENVGKQAILDQVVCGSSTKATACVFGCPLFDQDSASNRNVP